jgi:hypothetical protein
MNKFLPHVAALSILLLLGAGCAGKTPETQSETTEPKTTPSEEAAGDAMETSLLPYTNADHGITLQYPKTWQKDDREGDAPFVMFFSPQDGDDDLFRENLNLIVADLDGFEVSLKEYLDANIEQIETGIQGYNSLEIKLVSIAGTDAYRTTYTGTMEDTFVTWTQWYLLKDGKAYVLTYSGFENGYNKHLKAAENMIDSLEIK